METASLISFTLKRKGRSKGEANRFYRELYGYENYSHYGRYRSRIKGYLDDLPCIRYTKGVFMVQREDRGRVVRYLRDHGVTVVTWEVVVKEKERRILQRPTG
jgi:hypothetical protein